MRRFGSFPLAAELPIPTSPMPDSAIGTKKLLKRTWWLALPLLGLLIFAFVTSQASPVDDTVPTQAAKVLAAYPHDATAFTQGLIFEDGLLYEGTGHYGQSSIRQVDLETGKTQLSQQLNSNYFGEGITALGDRIYQLTWKERVCVIYDKATLKYIDAARYAFLEGWGLTDDGTNFYFSDGSNTIRVLDVTTFKEIRRIRVKNGRRSVNNLNELEFVRGEIYANIWHSDLIARIDPQSGQVLGWIDCSQLYPLAQRPDREHVLNGIAYDQTGERLFVTGKYWPRLFEIEVPQ